MSSISNTFAHPPQGMSVIGFIVNGVRYGSYIAPEWWPDAGMTMWMFVSGLTSDDVEMMAKRLKSVQWIHDDGHASLRRPLDVLRGVLDGSVTAMPSHAWRLWNGPPRWAYFVDFDNEEYEIWRYGATELCSGRTSFTDLTWEGWCALRQRMLDSEASQPIAADMVDPMALTRALARIQISADIDS